MRDELNKIMLPARFQRRSTMKGIITPRALATLKPMKTKEGKKYRHPLDRQRARMARNG